MVERPGIMSDMRNLEKKKKEVEVFGKWTISIVFYWW